MFPHRFPHRSTRLSIGLVPGGHLDGGSAVGHPVPVWSSATPVHLRDVKTMDDLADVTAPEPVEPGDLVASAEEFFRVEVVLWTPLDAPCVPVLARREELGAS